MTVLAFATASGAPRAVLARADAHGRVLPADPNLLWDVGAVGVLVPEAELTAEERQYKEDNPYGCWVTIRGRRVYLRGSAPLAQRKEHALRTHKPATAEKQRVALAQEDRVAKILGARVLDDNEPMDVVGRGYGVETKTFLDNSASKVAVHPDSLQRKLAWARREKATLHTVVVDARDTFEGGRHVQLYSGTRYWYRRGVGSFDLHTMTPVRDAAHLRALVSGKGIS